MTGFLEEVVTIGAPDRNVSDFLSDDVKAAMVRIAARKPFLDFVLHRTNADGSRQAFRVSGQPMFDQSCRFLGYRGIGVEMQARP